MIFPLTHPECLPRMHLDHHLHCKHLQRLRWYDPKCHLFNGRYDPKCQNAESCACCIKYDTYVIRFGKQQTKMLNFENSLVHSSYTTLISKYQDRYTRKTYQKILQSKMFGLCSQLLLIRWWQACWVIPSEPL